MHDCVMPAGMLPVRCTGQAGQRHDAVQYAQFMEFACDYHHCSIHSIYLYFHHAALVLREIPVRRAERFRLTPAPYEKAQTSEEKIYMQAVRSSRQLSTEMLCMSAWFLSSEQYSSVRGGTETCQSACVRVAVNNCVCWSSATPYKE